MNTNIKIITQNKNASYNYFIKDTYEAGIKLQGTEVKSIREGKCNINDSYIVIKNGRCYILNMFVAKYANGSYFNHEERQTRELLIHKHEILKLSQKFKLEHIALIPLQGYFKGSLFKIKFGICIGKNLRDKRETIKKRDLERELSEKAY